MNELAKEKRYCCGCSACMNSCPQSAISMMLDEEGFAYPKIHEEKCIHCGICLSVCRFYATGQNGYKQKYYEVKAKDNEIRRRSRSGGVFFLAAKEILSARGIVYGVSQIGTSVKYARADNIDGIILMQGSKYVDCQMESIFQSVVKDLTDNKTVLFSGTACKISGLYGFLEKQNIPFKGKLLTMDIVCHGVPSSKLYEDYLEYLEDKYNGKIKQFQFRDKSYGWNTHVETFIINGRSRTSDIYAGLFYSNYFLRPSCGVCPFTSYNRIADITIADFVGNERVKNNLNDNKGISMIMINSEWGNKWFSLLEDECITASLDKELTTQPNLIRPSNIPFARGDIWNYYLTKGFKKMLKKYGRNDILHRIKWIFRDYPKLLEKRKKLVD